MVIADMHDHHDLILYCTNIRCHWRVQFTRDEAIERFGSDLPADTLRKRAKCIKCGNVGAATYIQYKGKTGML
ncbi:hypothetical protein SULPSESMR1_01220 [Pseudosulfitobacter pseudonitzschiae]|uniref:Uncharacterized protein n=1 Tax=Pseudosulfitobacter pseudonitzschiae TaxID=1402135 RepID=A0A221JZ77_9RHOB|nr:hypothetical protein SULPSESMR1_01220 [Pseudosulfitobacter pseudonitzschiae]